MKLALPLAAAFFVAAVLPAAAWHRPWHDSYRGHHARHHHVYRHHRHHHHHRCVGLSAGTAHHSCGTRSGGPVGGLH